MNLRLINTTLVPPDGFRYVFPTDGWTAHAWDYQSWIQEARHHLHANNQGVPEDLEAQMEHQLCQTLEPGWCSFDDPDRPRPRTNMTWDDVEAGAKTFLRWITQGMQFVDKTEAERRALICSRCYLNVNVTGCSACKTVVSTMTKTLNRETKYDFALRNCGACRCFLKAKVWFPLEVFDKESFTVQSQYPIHCWLNKQSDNYRG